MKQLKSKISFFDRFNLLEKMLEETKLNKNKEKDYIDFLWICTNFKKNRREYLIKELDYTQQLLDKFCKKSLNFFENEFGLINLHPLLWEIYKIGENEIFKNDGDYRNFFKEKKKVLNLFFDNVKNIKKNRREDDYEIKLEEYSDNQKKKIISIKKNIFDFFEKMLLMLLNTKEKEEIEHITYHFNLNNFIHLNLIQLMSILTNEKKEFEEIKFRLLFYYKIFNSFEYKEDLNNFNTACKWEDEDKNYISISRVAFNLDFVFNESIEKKHLPRINRLFFCKEILKKGEKADLLIFLKDLKEEYYIPNMAKNIQENFEILIWLDKKIWIETSCYFFSSNDSHICNISGNCRKNEIYSPEVKRLFGMMKMDLKQKIFWDWFLYDDNFCSRKFDRILTFLLKSQNEKTFSSFFDLKNSLKLKKISLDLQKMKIHFENENLDIISDYNDNGYFDLHLNSQEINLLISRLFNQEGNKGFLKLKALEDICVTINNLFLSLLELKKEEEDIFNLRKLLYEERCYEQLGELRLTYQIDNKLDDDKNYYNDSRKDYDLINLNNIIYDKLYTYLNSKKKNYNKYRYYGYWNLKNFAKNKIEWEKITITDKDKDFLLFSEKRNDYLSNMEYLFSFNNISKITKYYSYNNIKPVLNYDELINGRFILNDKKTILISEKSLSYYSFFFENIAEIFSPKKINEKYKFYCDFFSEIDNDLNSFENYYEKLDSNCNKNNKHDFSNDNELKKDNIDKNIKDRGLSIFCFFLIIFNILSLFSIFKIKNKK